MATLATIFRRPVAPAAASGARKGPIPVEDLYRLRALPNEDVFLHFKRIDNSHVVREPNPSEGSKCWSAIAVAIVAGALVISAQVPGLLNIVSGYKLEDLKKEEAQLQNEMRVLNVEEAGLTSRDRLQDLAGRRDFSTPAPGQIYRLDPKGDGKLAMNRH